jgi:Na+/H+ antiporter NhaA
LPTDADSLEFLGTALLCGIADPLSLLMADQAFGGDAYASVATIGVLAGSVLAAVLGAMALSLTPVPVTPAERLPNA